MKKSIITLVVLLAIWHIALAMEPFLLTVWGVETSATGVAALNGGNTEAETVSLLQTIPRVMSLITGIIFWFACGLVGYKLVMDILIKKRLKSGK